MTTIKDVLDYAAAKNDVPPDLAFAVAWNESSLNPEAVGDNDTSFGLFQLHEGGELGSLTKEQAENPLTNAETALAEFKAVGPEEDLGAWAAKAQRPADAAGYAQRINVIVQAIKTGQMPDSYGRALNAETSVELPKPEATPEPAPVPEPAPAPEPFANETQAVESAISAQTEAVKDDTDAGKVSKAREVFAKLKVHVQELETLLS